MFSIGIHSQSSHLRVYMFDGVRDLATDRYHASKQLPKKDPWVSSENIFNQTVLRRRPEETKLHSIVHSDAYKMPQ